MKRPMLLVPRMASGIKTDKSLQRFEIIYDPGIELRPSAIADGTE